MLQIRVPFHGSPYIEGLDRLCLVLVCAQRMDSSANPKTARPKPVAPAPMANLAAEGVLLFRPCEDGFKGRCEQVVQRTDVTAVFLSLSML